MSIGHRWMPPLFHLCLTDGHPTARTYIEQLFCLKIFKKTHKLPKNTDRMNGIYCYLLFSVHNKCPPIHPDKGISKYPL